MDAARRRLEFIASHWRELLDEYPEQFVAVGDAGVVAVSPDVTEVRRAVAAQGMKSPRDVTIQHVSSKFGRMVL